MLDQPVRLECPSPSRSEPASTDSSLESDHCLPAAMGVETARHGTSPQSQAVVALPNKDRLIPLWAKLGVGLGGLALLGIVGWLALEQDPQGAARKTDDRPDVRPSDPALASPATGPTEAPDMVDSRSPPGPATVAPGVGASTPPSPSDPLPAGAAPVIAGDSGTPRAPDSSPSGEEDADKPEPMDRYEATVRIEKGDTLESLLRDMDFAPEEIRKATEALKPVLKGARVPAGETITLQVQTPSQADGKPVLLSLSMRPEARREITLERDDDGKYSARQRTFDVVLKLVRAGGVVNGSLRGSAEAGGIPPTVLAEMLRAFSWDVNLQYDVRSNDRFAVLIEQPYTTDGRLVGPGRVLWGRLTTGGGRRTLDVYRFKPDRGAEFFYYSTGESVVKSLLRTPMSLSRVSSRYGMRDHPILGFSSLHTGVDFAAPYGTPILAAGAGKIVAAGPHGGYGNWAKIDHGGGVATGYAHMARYAPGIRPGAHVRQGQVIGFVGSTGLSTGPHLHFELHQKGRPVNPLNARATQRASLGGKDLERFRAVVGRTDRARDGAEQIATR